MLKKLTWLMFIMSKELKMSDMSARQKPYLSKVSLQLLQFCFALIIQDCFAKQKQTKLTEFISWWL